MADELASGRGRVLKVNKAPSMRDFDEIVAKAREDARHAGLRESDIAEAIDAVRSGSKSKSIPTSSRPFGQTTATDVEPPSPVPEGR